MNYGLLCQLELENFIWNVNDNFTDMGQLQGHVFCGFKSVHVDDSCLGLNIIQVLSC